MIRDLGATEQLVISAKFASAHVLHVLKSAAQRALCALTRALHSYETDSDHLMLDVDVNVTVTVTVNMDVNVNVNVDVDVDVNMSVSVNVNANVMACEQIRRSA